MLAPIQHESMASYEKNTKDSSWKEIKALFSNLDKECSDRMKEDRVLNKEVTKNYFIEMRYVGQSHEIEVPLAAKINKNLIEDAESLFHEIHQNTYSYSDKSANVEFVTLRTVHQKLSQERSILEKAPRIIKKKINKTYREVCFSKKTGYKKIPIYKRADLTWGAELKGPAIIEQSDTTTILHQNHFLKVDKFNNLIIEVPSTQ
jgi:N-methylhydantoinase A